MTKTKTLKASKEFVVGKHNIGYVYSEFSEMVKDMEFAPPDKLLPYKTFERSMLDSEIKKEFGIKECTLGDVLYFLDHAPEECDDGKWSLFYVSGFVVCVHWSSGLRVWDVDGWSLDGDRWGAGYRVFSRNWNLKPKKESLDIETLALRVKNLEDVMREVAEQIGVAVRKLGEV